MPFKLSPDFHTIERTSLIFLICSGLFLLSYLRSVLEGAFPNVKAPVVGHRSIFEPRWLVRLRYVRGSREILSEGYGKFKSSMFKIRRIGTDVLIVSNKYAEEIRTLSTDANRSIEPFLHDFAGNYTEGMVFLESELATRVTQQKLTPSLGTLTSIMKSELDSAIQKEVPDLQGTWGKVDITPIFARIISHITARIFLGPEHGRREKWLMTTQQYTENLFITGMILRLFPDFLKPFIALMLPTYRTLRRNVADARRIVGDLVQARRAAEQEALENGTFYEKPTDLLQWTMDAAKGEERAPENLAQRILILSLSSIHTTALTMTQAIYDLCAHPEFLEPIREELVNVLREDGGWQKQTLNRFRKLDSLIKESQRFNPVFLVTFNRIYHHSMTLSDGTHLPAGTRIAVPSYSMSNDAAHVPGADDPAVFNPFRYSQLREDPAHPENSQKFLLAMTDQSNMAWGLGKYACPGRFYAANEMKMILAHMLLLYDFKMPEGCGRPKNFTIDTDMYPDRSARLLMRKRVKFADGIEGLVKA